MQQETYEISTMIRSEVDLAIEWAANEGWNPGIHDAECFHAADPHGFLIGLLNDEPIATVSAVRYGDSFGFIGLYIVRPEYRGKGYGSQILKAATDHLAGRNIGLDGVVAQQEQYRRLGFRLAYRNVRYEGRGPARASAEPNALVDLTSLSFAAVEAYDRAFFPAPRTRFLERWIGQPDARALGILQAGRLAGYGVRRKCFSGYKIGPLFADTPALAQALLVELREGIEAAEPFYLDVPEVNRAAVELAERHGMQVVFETARMYAGAEPDLALDRLYGVTTFELG
ncbi:GNAT family N-acetyltransferase [Azotobacter salinestris]|uniref:GNAT family N-acetyltransferase n=1 Tax=Azotobacter salinestris TaxID=69964 RepID=UPI001266A06A|nr:GNAT family N-acetyltransferase [Azotobacter salinestris]